MTATSSAPASPSVPSGVWDLLVVGGGTAGMVGAKTAAGLGARVLLVERDRTGGDCLWTGCVPSKSLLAAASAAATARSAGPLGVEVDGVRVDFPRVMAHVQAAIATIAPVDSPEALRAAGVHVIFSTARLTGPDTADVDGQPVRFRQALLATGAAPALPPIPGLDPGRVLTSDTVWDLTDLPTRLAVLGGGPIGCELAQAFARLGAEVTLVEGADRLLGKEDPDAASLVAESLRRDGVRLMLGQHVTGVTHHDQGGELLLADDAVVPFEDLLVAVGRRPRTDELGCAAAGVQLRDDHTVVLDDALRSTSPRIWAAGDLTGHPQFTHTAGVHGSLAASNAVLGLRRRVDPVVPRVTYTHPELAAVGVSTAAPPAGCTVHRAAHTHLDRAVTDGQTDGFTALVLDRRSRLVGATVVGPRAGETLGELTLAVRHGMRASALAGTTHAYPTYNDGVWNTAVERVQGRLAAPAARLLTGTVVRVRRALLDSHR
ncbi:Pyruvate/2-oxoglutarate dehydrogenase complex, dihydrolipoamide dehydrogenase (E3) component [Modestobacter sp. DSM 44400]|uniref:dihydrolipoyl dehydrogenase family protein n=1 Tax=Modestobacter sp. DSM 44400 TaxID=1550230 RepID=UPI00089A0AA5|nr:FAD-dependent oxidoreductase [Modestobacter sp. DSM 44400]SDY05012.1 Pyruvate/2-oxoglutarate dehydrogenase complex, dihydrolipoamide dehydrogenase (E3) component [Modestobacter sp. DSM 44400]